MSRQHNPATPLRHISTAYDGRGLGRDDPVWPLYVKEAGQWDEELADGWNKGMDTLLVFAALFSAIVTAFVIESHKGLRPDTPATTSTSGEFQPTTTAILVNVTWFLSLSLSMTVTLIAMLVKQWCTGFLSGRLAPPCVQARLRQARYDKLKSWRTEDIVLLLPMIMHAALGLFLVGLAVFLQDLSRIVFLPVLAVVVSTLAFYVITTLLPLVVSFCPYTTPLSSRKLWGCFCWLFGLGGSGDSRYTPSCQREEKRLCESTTPDKITARALDWLIRHSEEKSTVDMAIRGLAGAELENSVWLLLAQRPLMVLVAQRFTASFNGALEQDIKPGSEQDEGEWSVSSLYGRALANLARHFTKDEAASRQLHNMREQNIDGHPENSHDWEQSEALPWPVILTSP